MMIPNRDMFPTDETQRQIEDVKALIQSDQLDAAFLEHDKLANRAKRQYHRLGKLSIVLVAISAIFTLAEALFLPNMFSGFAPTLIAATMAGVGVVLQCYLLITKQKSKWLTHRFATERIRSIKFQAYQLVMDAQNQDDLTNRAAVFADRQLATLNNEMNAGIAILKNFSPHKALEVIESGSKPKNDAMMRMARDAYQELRVDYQRNFALSEVNNFQSRRRLFNSTQDMIYLGAAIFAFISLGAKIYQKFGAPIDTGWIDFLAVTLFVLGATEAIMDNATLEEQSQTRYEQYVRDIEVLESQTTHATGTFSSFVQAMERICMTELDHFCRAADRISYRF
jgi:hypothetical protein